MSLTPEMKALRNGRYGSSSVAALLIDPATGRSISPFSSPLKLFQEKLGLMVDEDPEETAEQEWGSIVESSILDAHDLATAHDGA